MKFAIYSITLLLAFTFGFWELRSKRQLSDEIIDTSRQGNHSGSLNDLSEKINRERSLSDLPGVDLRKLRAIVGLKFVFVALLIIEVIVLQR